MLLRDYKLLYFRKNVQGSVQNLNLRQITETEFYLKIGGKKTHPDPWIMGSPNFSLNWVFCIDEIR